MRRHRVPIAIALALAGTLAAGVAATVWQARAAQREAETAIAVREVLSDVLTAVDPDEAQSDAPVTVAQLLDRGTARVERELADRPDVMIPLLGDLAKVNGSIGRSDEAIALYERVLAMSPKPKDDAEWAARIALVGELVHELVTLERADDAEHAIATHVGAVALDALPKLAAADLVQARTRIARERGRVADAESLAQDLVTRERAALGEGGDPMRVADALNLLARVQFDRADFRTALETQRASHALVEHAHGPRSTQLATAKQNLAISLNQTGNAKDAIPLLEEVIEIRRNAYGDEHWLTNHARSELAVVLPAARRYAEAEAMFRRVIAWYREHRPADDTGLAGSLVNYGVMLYSHARYEEAERLFAEAYPVFRAKRGDDHPHTANTRTALYGARAELGDASAEQGLRDALAAERGGSELNTLGILLRRTGRSKEAIPLHTEALDAAHAEWDGDPQYTSWPRTLRAAAYLEAGMLDDARRDAETAVAAYREMSPEGGPRRSFAELTLGRILVALGEKEAGIAHLETSLEMRARLFGADGPLAREARAVLDAAR